MFLRTLDEIFNVCLLEHWGTPRFISSGYAKEVKNIWERRLKRTFGHLSPSQVGVSKVRRWHKSLSQTPIDGNRAKSVLSKLFAFAQENGWTNIQNPCFFVPNHTEKSRKRFASDLEIAKVGELLESKKEKFPREVAFLYLLMYTGSRPRALERAREEELTKVEIDGKTFGILSFSGKTGEEVVVVPPQVLEILKFPLGKFPRLFWEEIRKEAGCPTLWARDWRRTFATLGLSSGVSLGQVGEILNHKNAQTTMRYAKLLPLTKAKAVLEIGNELDRRLKR